MQYNAMQCKTAHTIQLLIHKIQRYTTQYHTIQYNESDISNGHVRKDLDSCEKRRERKPHVIEAGS